MKFYQLSCSLADSSRIEQLTSSNTRNFTNRKITHKVNHCFRVRLYHKLTVRFVDVCSDLGDESIRRDACRYRETYLGEPFANSQNGVLARGCGATIRVSVLICSLTRRAASSGDTPSLRQYSVRETSVSLNTKDKHESLSGERGDVPLTSFVQRSWTDGSVLSKNPKDLLACCRVEREFGVDKNEMRTQFLRHEASLSFGRN